MDGGQCTGERAEVSLQGPHTRALKGPRLSAAATQSFEGC